MSRRVTKPVLKLQIANTILSLIVCFFLAGFLSVAILAGVVDLGPVSATGKDDEAPVEPRVLAVETVTTRTQPSFTMVRSYTGITQAPRTVLLGFSRPGTIETVFADVGDEVYEGEILAKLDTRRLQLKRDAIEAYLEEEEEKEDSEDEEEASETEEEDAEASAESGSGATPAASGGPPGGPPPGQPGAQQPIIPEGPPTFTETDLDLVKLDLEDSDLVAPFRSIVSARMAVAGSPTDAGTPVFRLVERGKLEAIVGVPVDVATFLDPGAPVSMVIGKDSYTTKVKAILPEVDASARTRSVLFELSDRDAASHLPGETVEVFVERDVETPGFWVPLTALTRETRGLWSVYAVEDDESGGEIHILRRHFVEVLHIESERAWVRGTLSDEGRAESGLVVVADGTHRVAPGQRVTIARISAPYTSPESSSETDRTTDQTEP